MSTIELTESERAAFYARVREIGWTAASAELRSEQREIARPTPTQEKKVRQVAGAIFALTIGEFVTQHGGSVDWDVLLGYPKSINQYGKTPNVERYYYIKIPDFVVVEICFIDEGYGGERWYRLIIDGKEVAYLPPMSKVRREYKAGRFAPPASHTWSYSGQIGSYTVVQKDVVLTKQPPRDVTPDVNLGVDQRTQQTQPVDGVPGGAVVKSGSTLAQSAPSLATETEPAKKGLISVKTGLIVIAAIAGAVAIYIMIKGV